jgi:hypothetical protein
MIGRRDGIRTLSWQLNKIELLALFRPCNMRRNERVHESFKVRSPPLRQRVSNFPFPIDSLSGKLISDRRQPLIQPLLESINLVVFGQEIVARQLEKSIRNLQHEDVGMIVLVAD